MQRIEKCAKILKGYQCEAIKRNNALLPFHAIKMIFENLRRESKWQEKKELYKNEKNT